MRSMHELPRPGNPDFGSQERPFPLKGHSLFVSSIGERGAQQAIRFMQILNYSHGSEELLEAAAAFHAHPQIVNPMREAMHVSPGWFRKPDVVINNVGLAAKAFQKHSERRGDSGRVVFHFISYERGTARITRDVLQDFQRELPDVFHIGIVMIPASDPLSLRQFQREAEAFPLERLRIPLIVIDETLYRQRFFGQSMTATEDSFLYGLAGLVADRGLFPHLNKHNYQEALQTLAEETGVIGVGTAYGVIDKVGDWDAASVSDGFKKFVAHITALSLSENYRISSLPRKLNAGLDVVTVQIPMAKINGNWKEPSFFEVVHPSQSKEVQSRKIALPDHAVYIYGSIDTPTSPWDAPKPITSTHFYPAAKIPGVDFILELLRRETPAPSPVPV